MFRFILLLLAGASPAAPAAPDWASYNQLQAKHLRAMAEPALNSSSALHGFRQRIRLLVLPTFEPGYAIRIDIRQSGVSQIIVVSETGQGGYSPGKRKFISKVAGDADTTQFVQSAIRASNVEAEPVEAGPISAGNGEEGVDDSIVCTDGTMFFVEYFDAAGRPRTVKRHSCDLRFGKYRAIIPVSVMMHGLAKVPLPTVVWNCVSIVNACGNWDSYAKAMDSP